MSMHTTDPTINTFTINTQNEGDFNYILNFIDFNAHNIQSNELPFILEAIQTLGMQCQRENDNNANDKNDNNANDKNDNNANDENDNNANDKNDNNANDENDNNANDENDNNANDENDNNANDENDNNANDENDNNANDKNDNNANDENDNNANGENNQIIELNENIQESYSPVIPGIEYSLVKYLEIKKFKEKNFKVL